MFEKQKYVTDSEFLFQFKKIVIFSVQTMEDCYRFSDYLLIRVCISRMANEFMRFYARTLAFVCVCPFLHIFLLLAGWFGCLILFTFK